MKTIPTAKEFLKAKDQGSIWCNSDEELLKAFREFAKLHCQAQREAILEKAQTIDTYKTRWNGLNKEQYVEKDIYPRSIIEAYPLTNIK